MILFRLLLLPIKVVLALFGVAVRTSFRAGRLPVRVGGRAVRLVGFRGWLLFLVGLALGLLFAPGPGRELRARLQRLLDRDTSSDGDLTAKVAFELAHAPRTWHLTQPTVGVVDGRVRLSGAVPNESSREELGRVAGAIPGVAGVDNALTIATPRGADEAEIDIRD